MSEVKCSPNKIKFDVNNHDWKPCSIAGIVWRDENGEIQGRFEWIKPLTWWEKFKKRFFPSSKITKLKNGAFRVQFFSWWERPIQIFKERTGDE